MHIPFCVFLFVLHTSAFRWNTEAFTYIGGTGNTDGNFRRSGAAPCQMCLAPRDCFPFEPAACEFFIETTKILKKDKDAKDNKANPKLRSEIDSLVYDISDKANTEDLIQECIPYISKYTNCTKDNVCLGCKTCECDAGGYWNCTISETCRPDHVQIAANKRTLLNVIDALNKIPAVTRNKRSIYHSMRSLEDMDLDKEMNDNNSDEDKLFERDNEGLSLYIPIEPAITDTIIYDDAYIISTTTEKHDKKEKELVKLIVNSLINDALPDIFNANNYDFENNRVKRWLDDNNTAEVNITDIKETTDLPENDQNILQNKITFDELSEWLEEIHPHFHMEELNGAIADINDDHALTTSRPNLVSIDIDSTSVANTITSEGINPEYIAFEEVYGNIHFDNKTTIRRKPPLDHASKYFNFNIFEDRYYDDVPSDSTPVNIINDNLDITDTNVSTESTFTEDFTEYSLQGSTKVVVDLLERAKLDFENETGILDSSNHKLENLDNLDKINAINIMKRDVLSINKHENNLTNTNIKSDATTGTEINMLNSTTKVNISANKLNYLKDGVLEPIDNILNNKHSEIKKLLEIKERLVKFIQSFPDQTNFNDNDFKLNKSEYGPSFEHNLRRSNLTMIDKYKIKLKRDVYEVIKDVVAIRKLYTQSMKFPPELNFLIRSLKHYIHKTGFHLNDKIMTRRSNNGAALKSNPLWNLRSKSTIKNLTLSIFDLLVKNIRSSDALEFVSPHSRRIIHRLIKKYYVDDFAGTGLRIYDPHYNMTKDLSNIGSQWQIMTLISNTCPIFDKLYNMKKLHLSVAVDAEKINDALALINFARGRRMVPADETNGAIIAMNINKNLNTVRRMIEPGFKQATQRADVNSDEVVTNNHKKKNSFLSQIRRLLKKSKKNIAKLLRRNVPKTDIVKQIAKKDVEEMTRRKLQATMEKWQTNLNIIPRVKRSNKNYNKIDRRIANILPVYLRGKVHPEITKGDEAKKEVKERRKKKEGMERKKKKGTIAKKKPASPKLKPHKRKNLTGSAEVSKHQRTKVQDKSKKLQHPKKKELVNKGKREKDTKHETNKTNTTVSQHSKTKYIKKHNIASHAATKAPKSKRKNTKNMKIAPSFLKHQTTPMSNTNTVFSNKRIAKSNVTKSPTIHSTVRNNENTIPSSQTSQMEITTHPKDKKPTTTINNNTTVHAIMETTLPMLVKHTNVVTTFIKAPIIMETTATTLPVTVEHFTTINTNTNAPNSKGTSTKTESTKRHAATKNTKSRESKTSKKKTKS